MKRPLSRYASHSLVVIPWMESMEKAYGLLQSSKVRHLPVVDETGAVVGILSDRDFDRAMQIDQPDFLSGRVAKAEFDPNSRVRDFMSWPVEAIEEGKSLADASRMMLDNKISALVVTRGHEAVGIITTEDLLRAIIGYSEGRLGELRDDIRGIFYDSTIGQIAQTLANAGL